MPGQCYRLDLALIAHEKAGMITPRFAPVGPGLTGHRSGSQVLRVTVKLCNLCNVATSAAGCDRSGMENLTLDTITSLFENI